MHFIFLCDQFHYIQLSLETPTESKAQVLLLKFYCTYECFKLFCDPSIHNPSTGLKILPFIFFFAKRCYCLPDLKLLNKFICWLLTEKTLWTRKHRNNTVNRDILILYPSLYRFKYLIFEYQQILSRNSVPVLVKKGGPVSNVFSFGIGLVQRLV